MNCRGDDGIDAKRSRPSIGKTRYKCHARLERVLLVGTRSADYIRASGHSGRIQRPYTWLHPTPFAEMSDFSLAPRAPSIHGTEPDHKRMSAIWSLSGAKRTLRCFWRELLLAYQFVGLGP